MAAATMMCLPSSSAYHAYQPSYEIKKQSTEKFSLIVRLPGEEVLRIRNIKDGSSLRHVKRKLELLTGFAPVTYKLYNVEEIPLDDLGTLRVDDNICENEVLKLRLQHPYDRVHEGITSKHLSISDLVNAHEGLTQEEAFNIMFMCGYYGQLQLLRTLQSTFDTSVSATTPNGNTCLHAAAARDQVETAMELCQLGADIYQKNKHGDTPLDVALEFSSFTCERRLRLSQWTRRREKMTSETKYSQTFERASEQHQNNHQSASASTQSADLLPNGKAETHNTTEQRSPTKPYTTHEAPNHYISDRCPVRPSTASHLHQRPTTQTSTRSRMSAINHPMPKASVDKRRERSSRVRSAPPLNSEVRSQRLCKVVNNKQTPAKVEQENKKQRFKVTKPQYLQYIKSSTGIVEEDYFADIFPEQTEEPKDTRSFDDQMKRNERIFKSMFKETGVVHECSDSDSGEERARELANRKAIKRWNKKQHLKKQEERAKLTISPYTTKKAKGEGLGELLLIGDTSRGEASVSEPEQYIRAYQAYKEQAQHSSATNPTTTATFIDPLTYEQWVSTKPHRRNDNNKGEKTTNSKEHLVKRIDYQTWLEAATKRINQQHMLQKKEQKQKKDFEEWIQELKDEVGTFDYWRRRKDEQLAKEKKMKLKKQEEERLKQTEIEKKKQLAKEIYKHWAINKEMSKLKQEENKLAKERERLHKARTMKQ